MNKTSARKLTATLLSIAGLSACAGGSSKVDTSPYQYRDLPEQPREFISAPQDPRENQDAVATAAEWASSTDKKDQGTHRPNISGTCLIHSEFSKENAGEDMGCVGVTLVLVDSRGVEVDRQMTHKSGKFLFVVDAKKKYTLHPLSKQYSSEFDKPGPYSAGDVLTLKLLIQ